jgi:DNA repair exonuclease SbcCD ATPase subunit
MRFTHVTIQNFLSFGDSQKINLDRQGLVAVFGQNRDSQGADSNGAGKSTVMEAIVWVLFGQTMREYKGDEVINRVVGKNCMVELGMEDEGNIYIVQRTRKAKAKKPNNLTLFINGSDAASGGVIADTQEQIQTIIGMDFATFTQSVMLWHGARPFSQMTDRDQKAVLEDILQIGHLARAREVVRRRLSAKQQDLASAKAKLTALAQRRDETRITLGKLEQQRDQYAEMQAQKRLQLVRRKVEAEAKIEEVYHTTGLQKLLLLQEELREQETELEALRQDVHQKRLGVTRKIGTKKAEIARAQGVAEGRQRQLSADLSRVDQLVGKECPTCKQVLTPQAATRCMDEWEQERNDIAVQTLKNLSAKLKRLEGREKREMKELDKEDHAIASRWTTLQGLLRESTEQVRKRQAALQLITQLEQQSWAIQTEIDKLLEEENPYGVLCEEQEEELVKLEERDRFLAYRVRSLDIELSHLVWWDQGFSNQGLKSYVMDSVVPFLTKKAQHYADVLSGGDLKIRFSTRTQLKSGEYREKFQVEVTNQQGADVYRGNSDGEKRRIDIAVGWALGDLAATRANKAIRFKGLDEPFEHLDETGEDSVIKLLHHVLSEYETVLCVTHSTHLRNQFPTDLMVTKEHGLSTVS